MVQNGNGNSIQEKTNGPTEEVDCLCDETKKELETNGKEEAS